MRPFFFPNSLSLLFCTLGAPSLYFPSFPSFLLPTPPISEAGAKRFVICCLYFFRASNRALRCYCCCLLTPRTSLDFFFFSFLPLPLDSSFSSPQQLAATACSVSRSYYFVKPAIVLDYLSALADSSCTINTSVRSHFQKC